MAIKKSELYSSLWSSCDELRGGMDASQYKDYVLSLLFIKYVSDKYEDEPYAPITIPPGASFSDMVALKGKSDIGDQINKKIIAPLASANDQLSQSDFPDFNDSVKLGDGKEKVDRLTNLIGIFENPALDFSQNRAEGDDILGDAYEYLMRHFATESGKSKGQFYTPAEVSRVIAQVLGIKQAKTTTDTTVYDPTCGSGSLLLKVGDEAGTLVTLYGQEKDAATSGLARMNMILHNNPTALIVQGNTITDPKFKDGEAVKTFDYVVANPPFSDKRWSTGLDPLHDPHGRFKGFGIPPAKQGDYAYLLHIVRSLKSAGRGACILPHGVLFRGHAEAEIRRSLIRRGYIKGIIGLPANLFYGTGIPACIVVIDKHDAQARKGIFMIDASQGFMKDGPKNRLRAQDVHRIVDAFTRMLEVPSFSRLVPFGEIEKNEFNLNLPRYIDSRKLEDRQDIEAHLRGGIPEPDIEALKAYWAVCPGLRSTLFGPCRPGYVELSVKPDEIRPTIFEHPEFAAFIKTMNAHFAVWHEKSEKFLKALEPGCHPKEIIYSLSENLLAHYTGKPLINKYDVYQHLMDYWAEEMQDDCYLIATDGWKAEPYRVVEKDKKGRERDKGWACDLIPKPLIIGRFLADEQEQVDRLTADLELAVAARDEFEEEHSGEEGVLADFDKLNKAAITARLKEIKSDKASAEEAQLLRRWLELDRAAADLKKELRDAEDELDALALARYPTLTESEIKMLVVDDKWLTRIEADVHGEMDRIGEALAQRIRTLGKRYETPMPIMADRVAELAAKIGSHLERIDIATREKNFTSTKYGEAPTAWRNVSLERISAFITKGSTPTTYGFSWVNYGVLFLRSECVSESGLDLSQSMFISPKAHSALKRSQIQGGDILVTITGNVGRVVRLTDNFMECNINQHLARIRIVVADVVEDFVFHFLSQKSVRNYFNAITTGQAYPQISLAQVRGAEISLPEYQEQLEIANILNDMDAEITILESRLAKARYIKQGLMDELLTGKVRLV